MTDICRLKWEDYIKYHILFIIFTAIIIIIVITICNLLSLSLFIIIISSSNSSSSNLPTYFHYNCYFVFFCRCILHGLLRKLNFCFFYIYLKGNSPRFGLAKRGLAFDLSWFQKLILCIINKLKNRPPKFYDKFICFWNMFILIVYFIL